MIKRFDRYIGKVAFLHIALVLAVLLGLFLFFAFLEEADDISDGGYTTWVALQYVLLHAPKRIYELFPMAVLLGTLLGLGMLANNNELTVMRAAGMSPRRMIHAILLITGVLLVLVMLLGEQVAPVTSKYAKTLRSMAKSGQVALSGGYSFWLRDGDYFINIKEVLPQGELRGVFFYRMDKEQRLQSMSYAQSAYYRDGGWVVRDISETALSGDTSKVRQIPEIKWKSSLSPDLLGILILKPDDLGAVELYRYVSHLKSNDQEAKAYELALWGKAAYPLVCFVMVLLAAPVVFGSLRNIAISRRVLTGTLIGLGFYILNETVTRSSLLYDIPPLAGAFLPGLIFLLAALALMRRL